MPSNLAPMISWISTQRERMIARVTNWASVNSHSLNLPGISKVRNAVIGEFTGLGGEIRHHALEPFVTIDGRGLAVPHPLAAAVSITKRPRSPVQVLLNIHLDTVYPADAAFQSVSESGDKLHGPGVADAKGGLAVMLTALEALERSPDAERVGWRVLLNTDEEIGSPGSAALLAEFARECHFGLLYEPALPDGALVNRRRGSGNFSIIFRGRAAHAGRDFSSGRSALLAAAKISLELHALNQTLPGVTLNIGAIDGGGPANVVPDLAICRINIRTMEPADEESAIQVVRKIVSELNSSDGVSAEIHGQFRSPPKIPDQRTLGLLGAIISCGNELGLNITTRASGGASDGNRLAAAGLPNIDSLGVRGDRIHSPEEYLIIPSLVERAQLSALLLLKIAGGDIDPSSFCR